MSLRIKTLKFEFGNTKHIAIVEKLDKLNRKKIELGRAKTLSMRNRLTKEVDVLISNINWSIDQSRS